MSLTLSKIEELAGGSASIRKKILGAPSLRVLQGWVFLLSLFQFRFSNFASLPEDVFDLIKDRGVAVGGRQRLNPKKDFGCPILAGFARVGLSFGPFPISIFEFRFSTRRCL
jgi:hypothetical protein